MLLTTIIIIIVIHNYEIYLHVHMHAHKFSSDQSPNDTNAEVAFLLSTDTKLP